MGLAAQLAPINARKYQIVNVIATPDLPPFAHQDKPATFHGTGSRNGIDQAAQKTAAQRQRNCRSSWRQHNNLGRDYAMEMISKDPGYTYAWARNELGISDTYSEYIIVDNHATAKAEIIGQVMPEAPATTRWQALRNNQTWCCQ